MDTVLEFLTAHQYLAMFGILFLCGVGLPIPEEVTLVGSGLLVGWGEAEFFPTSVACVAGILAGDSVIFGLGHLFGQSFLSSRPMRIFLSPKRQERVGRFFRRHDKKAVFLARFVAGIRIGVYAYAGALRTSWVRFLFLDFLGAMLSGPTSIWVGKWAATKFAADRHEAIARAEAIMHEAGHLVLLGIAGVVLVYVVLKWSRYTRERRAARRQERSSARATAPPEREHSPPPKAN